MTKKAKVEEFLTRIFRDYPALKYEIKCTDIDVGYETYRVDVHRGQTTIPVFLRVLKSNVLYLLRNGQYIRTSEMDFAMELFLSSLLTEI